MGKISRSKEGEKKRKLSQTTTSMTSTQEQNYEVIVNGEKIFLNSTNAELAANAGKLLVTHLTNQSSLPSSSSPSSMKYSRTDLLTLATSPLSREAPENWDRMVSKLPKVILRSPETSRLLVLVGTPASPPPCQEVLQCSGIWGTKESCRKLKIVIITSK